jgi:hypothetical protein
VLLESNGKRACYIGDLIPTTAHIQPTWVMGYDLFPLECIEKPPPLLQRGPFPKRWLVIFTHDEKNAMGVRDARRGGKSIPRSLWKPRR